MAVLYNGVCQKALKARLFQETEPCITFSFYQYLHIDDPKVFRDELYTALHALNVFGRIYVAHEGINAQASAPASRFEEVKAHLHSIAGLEGVRLNIAV